MNSATRFTVSACESETSAQTTARCNLSGHSQRHDGLLVIGRNAYTMCDCTTCALCSNKLCSVSKGNEVVEEWTQGILLLEANSRLAHPVCIHGDYQCQSGWFHETSLTVMGMVCKTVANLRDRDNLSTKDKRSVSVIQRFCCNSNCWTQVGASPQNVQS